MNYSYFKNIFLILLLSFFSFSTYAQKNRTAKLSASKDSFARKGTHWLNLNMGLSAMNSNLAILEDPFIFANENRRNFGFILQPKFQVFVKDRLSVGFHLGIALDEFENKQIDFQQNKNNYFAGLQSEYYFVNIKNFFLISSEVDFGIHYLENKFRFPSAEISNNYHTYLKSGLHINFNFMLNEHWVVYAKFYDLVSYTNSENNFFGFDEGIQINNSLDNFINFPQFGVLLKL